MKYNISRQYHSKMAYGYIKNLQMTTNIKMTLNSHNTVDSCLHLQPLAILIDCWMNPLEDLEYFDYTDEIETLSEEVKNHIQCLDANANDDGTIPTERKIFNAINHIMFRKKGFLVNNGNFYASDNSYLHKVRTLYIFIQCII